MSDEHTSGQPRDEPVAPNTASAQDRGGEENVEWRAEIRTFLQNRELTVPAMIRKVLREG